jgi:hypothetical protein
MAKEVVVGFTMQSRYFSRTVVKELLVAGSDSIVRLRSPVAAAAEDDSVVVAAVLAVSVVDVVAGAVDRVAERSVTEEVCVSVDVGGVVRARSVTDACVVDRAAERSVTEEVVDSGTGEGVIAGVGPSLPVAAVVAGGVAVDRVSVEGTAGCEFGPV